MLSAGISQIVASDAVRLVACAVMAAGLDSEDLLEAITPMVLEAAFRVTSSNRVMVRLDYRGDGAKVYWDDVRLDPWHQRNGS